MSEPKWMPVFVVVEAPGARPQVAAHPSYAGKLSAGPHAADNEDYCQRIGTALFHENGTITVQLTALPLNGRLLLRPPAAHEHRDPTREH